MVSATFDSLTWPEGIVQLLDDHHLVVLSDRAESLLKFGERLAEHLQGQVDAQVVKIDGARAGNLETFRGQLDANLRNRTWQADPPPRTENRLSSGANTPGGMEGVLGLLRGSPPEHVHRRYLIWHDADVMLESDVHLFSRLVNTLLGGAAEREHLSPDPLLLQRVVFLGGAKLGAYAEDIQGQFCSWLVDEDGRTDDDAETAGRSRRSSKSARSQRGATEESGSAADGFWETYAIVQRPPVLTYRIDG